MLPRLTADLPPMPGIVRRDVQQTRIVEELLRPPSGAGDHFWIRLRKIGCSTKQAAQAIARAAGCEESAVKYITTRDRHAVCEQWFSVAEEVVDSPKGLMNTGYKRMIKVLQVVPSDRPLTPGLLRCLAYRLHVGGGAADDGLQRCKAIMDRLRVQGCPNYHPAGFGGTFVKWGRMLLQGKRLPAAVQRQKLNKPRCLQAVQAWLFNTMVAARLEDGLFERCLPGDLLRTGCQLPPKDRSQECLTADDIERAERRMGSWEAVQLLPLFGDGMEPAAGEAAEREAAVLAELGARDDRLARLRGGRRALRFQPQKVAIELDGPDIWVACELDEEAYASVLLEELLKPEAHLK